MGQRAGASVADHGIGAHPGALADADAIGRLVGIVEVALARGEGTPVVVVSAMSGVTDSLIQMAKVAQWSQDALKKTQEAA